MAVNRGLTVQLLLGNNTFPILHTNIVYSEALLFGFGDCFFFFLIALIETHKQTNQTGSVIQQYTRPQRFKRLGSECIWILAQFRFDTGWLQHIWRKYQASVKTKHQSDKQNNRQKHIWRRHLPKVKPFVVVCAKQVSMFCKVIRRSVSPKMIDNHNLIDVLWC